ncbi:MAG: thioredoxin fold domain-containing protein [Chromatiales bacterium]|nr:thioredoxin fold domain-containing protein [Chromatiales bacterium]
MIRTTAFASLLLLWLITMTPAIAATQPGKVTGGKISEHPSWFKESFLDIAEDVEEAADSDKHVILFMHLNGCPYCYKMADENFANAPYTDFIKENFDVIAVNIKGDREIAFDENTTVSEKELAGLLKVRYTPTIIFLNKENKTVARVNGYRSVEAFKHMLDYVKEQAYTDTTLANFIEARQKKDNYSFRNHPQFKKVSNLQTAAQKPLAVLFEDSGCDACNTLHDGHLSNPDINKVLENFTVVRLDALSEEKIVDVDGNTTTPKAFAKKLGLTYRPGIVLFDKGREIQRIDGLLYTYHFTEVLRYVGERHYEKYPNSFYDYLDVRTEAILASGKDVDLSK